MKTKKVLNDLITIFWNIWFFTFIFWIGMIWEIIKVLSSANRGFLIPSILISAIGLMLSLKFWEDSWK